MTSYATPRPSLAASLVASALGRPTVVAVPTAFIQLLGDCTAATFLAQCCHLSEKSPNPEGWFERSHDLWRAELDLSPEQVRRCVRDCAGMIEVRRMGLPARNFYRVLPEGVTERLAQLRPPTPVTGTSPAPTADVSQDAQPQEAQSTPHPVRSGPPTLGGQPLQRPELRLTPPLVTQPTPQHSSLGRKKKDPERAADDVRRTPPACTQVLSELLQVWNTHRGKLPEAAGLSTARRRALTVLLADCPDTQAAARLLTDATKEVASDEFWQQKRFGLDTLLPRVLGKAEAYRSRQPETRRQAAPQFGVGQRVLYRRERYTVEAVSERYIDLYDEQNGSARILLNSDDAHSLRPLEVRA